jgi:hypothetical protein
MSLRVLKFSVPLASDLHECPLRGKS